MIQLFELGLYWGGAMPKRRHLPSVLISTAAGAACLALATPAWAAADPPGANGTVKIDGVPLDNGIDNEPHVSCDFEVDFFDFDKGERANIVFSVQSPTGQRTELLRRDGVLVSDDPASGGKPDPDETFRFSATQLGLAAYTPHPKQGYHVKLTVERIGAPGAGKHKVFWVEPCEASTPPSTPGSPPPGGGNGGTAGGGGLPVTGTAVGSIALLGGAMVAGGAALLLIRRRRDTTGAS
jgi:LPXTG-motif cell wall-anchored protein